MPQTTSFPRQTPPESRGRAAARSAFATTASLIGVAWTVGALAGFIRNEKLDHLRWQYKFGEAELIDQTRNRGEAQKAFTLSQGRYESWRVYSKKHPRQNVTFELNNAKQQRDIDADALKKRDARWAARLTECKPAIKDPRPAGITDEFRATCYGVLGHTFDEKKFPPEGFWNISGEYYLTLKRNVKSLFPDNSITPLKP